MLLIISLVIELHRKQKLGFMGELNRKETLGLMGDLNKDYFSHVNECYSG